MSEGLLQIMAGRGQLALDVAMAMTELTLAGYHLGELETRSVIGIDGERRDIRVVPAAWMRRLERAVIVGAFDRKSPREIAGTIVSTPEPAEVLA